MPWRDRLQPSQPSALHYKPMETFCREQWSPPVISNSSWSLPHLFCSLIVPTEAVSFTIGLLNWEGARRQKERDFRGLRGLEQAPTHGCLLLQEKSLSFLNKQEVTKLRWHHGP
jgi:hypothetical protein